MDLRAMVDPKNLFQQPLRKHWPELPPYGLKFHHICFGGLDSDLIVISTCFGGLDSDLIVIST